jgi:hypothetical protein
LIPGLLPQLRRPIPLQLLQERRPAERVREIERIRARLAAVESQTLVVAPLRLLVVARVPIDIAEMANRVRELERSVRRTKEGHCLLIGSRAGMRPMDRPLDLSQFPERTGQGERVGPLAERGNGAGEQVVGGLEQLLTLRAKSLRDELIRFETHARAPDSSTHAVYHDRKSDCSGVSPS